MNAFDTAYASAFGGPSYPCSTWYSTVEAQDDWRDAPHDDELLQQYLDVAAQQVIAYGPARIAETIADSGCVPLNYRMAQLMQARNLWNAAKTDPSGAQGADPGFTFTPFPLDWSVKAVIRPKTAAPVVS